MTLVTAMLPLTWEHEKVAWFVMAALVGMSSLPVSGPSGAARQPLAAPERSRREAAGGRTTMNGRLS